MKSSAFPYAASLVSWGCVACLLTLLNLFLGSFVHLPPFASAAGHLIAILYLAAELAALLLTARAASQLPASAGFLLIAGGLLSLPILLQILAAVAHLPPSLDLLADFLPLVAQVTVSNLLAPLGMTLLGAGIGRIIKHPNTLLAGSAAAIFFDIVAVTLGTVAQLMKNGSGVIAAVSVGAGGGGAHHVGIGVPAGGMPSPICGVTIGPADVLFMALFLSAVWSMRLSFRATQQWMFGLLFTALVIVELTGLPIPALAPMGVAVLIANRVHAAFTRQERRDLAIGAVFAVFCAGLMIVGARRFIKPGPPTYGFAFHQIGTSGPLLVVNILRDSPAYKGGLLPGDVIERIDGIPTPGMTTDRFNAIRAKSRDNGGLHLSIERPSDRKPHELVLKPAN